MRSGIYVSVTGTLAIISALISAASAQADDQKVPTQDGLKKAEPILARIAEQAPSLMPCFDKHLPDEQKSVKVSTKFIIGKKGTVIAATVFDNPTGSKAFAQCLHDAIHMWTFAPPKEKSLFRVKYPFIFERGKPQRLTEMTASL